MHLRMGGKTLLALGIETMCKARSKMSSVPSSMPDISIKNLTVSIPEGTTLAGVIEAQPM
ncbi:hypothetical protein J6590_069054, partial [Homalodisca vitripennis]